MHADSASRPAHAVHFRAEESAGRLRGARSRGLLLALYLLITLPVLPALAVNVSLLRPLLAIDLGVRALPLFITALIDRWFLDAGEVTPELIPLWSALTGVMLWPLLTLALWPALWDSRRWRRTILGYAAAVLVATTAAAYWVFTHLGIFF